MIALDLETITNQLLSVPESDLERIQELLNLRAAVVNHLAASDPRSFSAAELASLKTALRKGEFVVEKVTLMQRAAASEWQRLNRLRTFPRVTDSTLSLSC